MKRIVFLIKRSWRWWVFFSLCLVMIPPDTGHTEPIDHEDNRKIVRLGIVTLYHPLVMYRKFQPFADYLTSKTPYRFELKISQEYDSILEFLQNGTIDAAMLGGLTYIKAREAAGVIPIAAALGSDGKPYCRGIFITQTSRQDIVSIRDIRNKSFAFASKYSTSGSLAPFFHLYKNEGITHSELGNYKHLNYHDSVAREVLRGNFDAGVVLDTVAMRYQDKGIRFIGETAPFPGFLIAVTKTADPELVKNFKGALLDISTGTPEERNLMSAWDDKIQYGFTGVSDSDYEDIRNMLEFLSGSGIMPGVIK